MMQICEDTEELEIFDTNVIQDLITFKWKIYGLQHHLWGLIMHFLYTFMIIIYVIEVYQKPQNDYTGVYTLLLLLGIVYPLQYETRQLFHVGLTEYLININNYMDFLYIWGSIANVVL
jgi:hypothetical protein